MRIKIYRIFKKFTKINLLKFAGEIYHSMISKPEKFTEPEPSNEIVQAAIQKCEEKSQKVKLIKEDLITAKNEEDSAYNELIIVMDKRADYVEYNAKGDVNYIVDSGFEPRANERSTQVLKKVKNLQSEFTERKGEIKLTWNPIANIKSYQTFAKVASDNDEEHPWESIGLSSRSSFTAKELISGQRMYFKVCAFYSNGEGPESDYIERIIP